VVQDAFLEWFADPENTATLDKIRSDQQQLKASCPNREFHALNDQVHVNFTSLLQAALENIVGKMKAEGPAAIPELAIPKAWSQARVLCSSLLRELTNLESSGRGFDRSRPLNCMGRTAQHPGPCVTSAVCAIMTNVQREGWRPGLFLQWQPYFGKDTPLEVTSVFRSGPSNFLVTTRGGNSDIFRHQEVDDLPGGRATLGTFLATEAAIGKLYLALWPQRPQAALDHILACYQGRERALLNELRALRPPAGHSHRAERCTPSILNTGQTEPISSQHYDLLCNTTTRFQVA
jgi:hypothetical protein